MTADYRQNRKTKLRAFNSVKVTHRNRYDVSGYQIMLYHVEKVFSRNDLERNKNPVRIRCIYIKVLN